MKSREPSREPLLELDGPFGPADAAALRRAPQPMSFEEYLRFLASFPEVEPAVLRARRGPCGEPFRLTDDPADGLSE